jgi:hypothetical protein
MIIIYVFYLRNTREMLSRAVWKIGLPPSPESVDMKRNRRFVIDDYSPVVEV